LALKAGVVTTCTFMNTKVERAPQCNDGKDNDGDGLIDLKDTGCKDVKDNDESDSNPTVAQCSDGNDNDADGLVDAKDPGCWANQSNPNTYNPKDNSERSPKLDCPDPNAPVVFTGARLKFMEQLKLRDPELYASFVALMQTRNTQLAKLCLSHPEIYKKLMDRRASLLLKLEGKMQNKEKDDKNDKGKKSDENKQKDEDNSDSGKGGAQASLQAKADTFVRVDEGKIGKFSLMEFRK